MPFKILNLRLKGEVEEDMEVVLGCSIDEGVVMVDADMEEIGADIAEASSKTPKRKALTQDPPSASKKVKPTSAAVLQHR